MYVNLDSVNLMREEIVGPQKYTPAVLLLISCGAFGFLITAPARAADAVDEDSNRLVIEEIIVTARKRAESLQDIPLAVTAFTAADIESAGLRDVGDVANLTPGFNMAPLFGGDQSTPVIRGLSTTIGEANVGFFVDGVYSGSRQTMTNLLGNFVQRIEVAKGPQSALYGRNTFGGAINYVTRQPSEEFEGELEASYGSDGKEVLRATIGGPFGDSDFSYRLAAMSDEFDGYYTNELTGDDLDYRDTKGALGTIAFSGEQVVVALNVMLSRVEDGDSPLRFEENNDVFFSFAGLPPDFQMFTGEVPAHDDGFAVTPGGLDRDQLFASLKVDWNFGPATFTSITGYNDFSHDRLADDDYSANDFHFLTTLMDVTELSQEFRLTSNGSGPVRWMIGLYGYSLEDDTDVNNAYQGFLLPIFGGLNSVISQETDSLAVFGSLDWDISDRLALNLAARYGNEEKSVVAVDTALPTGVSGVYENEEDWNSFLPRASLNWRFSDDHMAYASYAYSEKAGGFNVVTITGNVLPEERAYEPETSDNYEIGLKSTFADGRVRTTLAAYYIKWQDQIVRAIGQGGALLNSNAGETTSKGFEFELLAQLSENWDLRGGLSYNESQYDDYFFAILAAVGMNPVLDGTQLQYAPEWTANVSLGYTLPMASGWEWFNRLDASYTDEQTIVQTANAFVGSTDRVNFRTGFSNDNWTFTLWAYNLFEPDDALTGVFTGNPSRLPDLFIFGARQGFPAFSPLVTSPDRRSYGVTVKYRF
jgi:iron complex outermembrane receptor protein